MKRLSVKIAVIFIVALLGTGCGKEKVYKIGVSQCSQDDWRIKMNEEIEREIMFHPDARVEIRSADDSNEKQISDIRYFADNGFDIIIAAPNEADAITPVIKEVYSKGIPVVLFDRNIHGDSFTAFQGADNVALGESAARYASNLLKGKGTVVELYGLKGSTPAIERHKGFVNELAKEEGIRIAASEYADWNYDDAFGVADSLFTLYPSTNLVYAHNDRMAIAAADAARKHGIDPYIIGIDAAPEIGLKAVSDSIIDATFLYPTEGHRLIRTAMKILKGEPYERMTKFPVSSPVDISNADILLLQNESLKEETSKMKELKTQIDSYWDKHSAQTVLFYAAIVILVLLCVLLFVLLRMFWQNRRHQDELMQKNLKLEEQHEMQKELNEQLREATQSKLAFFTNVSHDLRTPLTLIAEPVEQLSSATNLTVPQKGLLGMASRNISILKRLINQILDFRKYENGKLGLNLSEADFTRLAREWTDAFRSAARSRGLKFAVEIPEGEDIKLAIDVEKIERVVYNLLSNAIKYTPANGEIVFSCSCDGTNLRFSVKDNGQGIDEEDCKKIFDRFYQVDRIHPKGSGIGLSLARAFVELHDGSIKVESRKGEGTVFTVTIPVTHCEIQEENAPADSPRLDSKEVENELCSPEIEKEVYDDGKPLLLVIDDNEDIRALLSGILSDQYNVITAPGGKEGLRLAARHVPDAIICDVMMPDMDGMECCRRIKEEISTSHIPVLLLTACSMDEQRAQGYDSGADGYLSKPFNSTVLLSRLRSLIDNRRRIKDIWGESSPAKVADLSVPVAKERTAPSDTDNDFYSRFIKIMEKEMGDPDLNVDSLASKVGLSRSQFYRKIKALTNYSPVELLRNMRLKRARHLLTTTDRSISEIGYEVGFSTPAYFTKCYKEAFGETPSDLRGKL